MRRDPKHPARVKCALLMTLLVALPHLLVSCESRTSAAPSPGRLPAAPPDVTAAAVGSDHSATFAPALDRSLGANRPRPPDADMPSPQHHTVGVADVRRSKGLVVIEDPAQGPSSKSTNKEANSIVTVDEDRVSRPRVRRNTLIEDQFLKSTDSTGSPVVVRGAPVEEGSSTQLPFAVIR